MSHSQATSLLNCGEQYRLTRILGVPDPSGWALTGGKALHRATEEFDRAMASELDKREPRLVSTPSGNVGSASEGPSDSAGGGGSGRWPGDRRVAPVGPDETVENFERDILAAAKNAAQAVLAGAETAESYLTELVDLTLRDELLRLQAIDLKRADVDSARLVSRGRLKEADSQTLDELFPDLRASGRASKEWPGKENGAWWAHHLPIFIKDWVTFRMTSGYELAYANGVPAIEMDVSAAVGSVSIKAYLDRVMLHPVAAAPMVLDLKTNSREPSDPEQLGLYAAMLEARGMPRPRWGAFWMARTGQLGKVHDLSRYTARYFGWKFGTLKRQRDAGELIANTHSAFCSSCPVRDYCYAVGGRKADQVPKPWEQVVESSHKRDQQAA